MNPRIAAVSQEAAAKIAEASTLEQLEQLRIHYLGKKGAVTELLHGLREIPDPEKPQYGKSVNELKEQISGLLAEKQKSLSSGAIEARLQAETLDITLPGKRVLVGKKHPLAQVMDQVVEIFRGLGFRLEEGPEIETDYYNFEALNFPANHPARDMQDTFFFPSGHLLRTHTSPVQIRVMEKSQPPLRFIAAGKVYRHDADTTHSPLFHQIEGFMIDTDVTFADLKGVLQEFLSHLFGGRVKMRFRPSFFPFTEPSAEVDISCVMCAGKGCRVCKNTGWLEILGCGMVHPNVLEAVKCDASKWQGFAFGMGIERIAMLKFGIDDIRLFFENDLRFLNQF